MKNLTIFNFKIDSHIDGILAVNCAGAIDRNVQVSGDEKIFLSPGSTPDFCIWEVGSRWGHYYRSGRLTEWNGIKHETLVDHIDLSDAMTPEEIEAAITHDDIDKAINGPVCDSQAIAMAIDSAEKEYRRKFAASGGSAKSPRKAAASRLNGKKGGRPRKAIPLPV